MKIRLFIISLLFAATAGAQINDTATLRNYINANFYNNGTRAITGTALNYSLSGLLNVFNRYKVDTFWVSHDTLMFKIGDRSVKAPIIGLRDSINAKWDSSVVKSYMANNIPAVVNIFNSNGDLTAHRRLGGRNYSYGLQFDSLSFLNMTAQNGATINTGDPSSVSASWTYIPNLSTWTQGQPGSLYTQIYQSAGGNGDTAIKLIITHNNQLRMLALEGDTLSYNGALKLTAGHPCLGCIYTDTTGAGVGAWRPLTVPALTLDQVLSAGNTSSRDLRVGEVWADKDIIGNATMTITGTSSFFGGVSVQGEGINNLFGYSGRIRTIGAGGAYNISDASDFILNCANAADLTIHLPSVPGAGMQTTRVYYIKKTGNNTATVTITPVSGNTIDGNASVVLSTFGDGVALYTDGLQWYKLP